MGNSNKPQLGGMAISKECFDFIVENTKQGSRVLEFGSGYGTCFLSKNFSVHSIEENDYWYGKYNGVNYNIKYFKAKVKSGFYQSEVLKNLDEFYSTVILDGPNGGQNRVGILKLVHLLPRFDLLVIDDVQEMWSAKIAFHMAKHYEKSELNFGVGDGKMFAWIKV